MADTKYIEDVIPVFKKAKEVIDKCLEKFITDGDHNFGDVYKS